MSDALHLDPVLDLQAAAPLQAALLARRGGALEVDASAVQRLGGLCLQVLISAHCTWCDDALPFAVIPRSAAFTDALALFGATSRLDEAPLDGPDPR
jgi:chemotaxis protein CheX